MTTPTRIANFLFQSALCLGLVAGPVYAGQKTIEGEPDSHTLTRDRDGSERVADAARTTQEEGATTSVSQAAPGTEATR